MLVMVRVEDYKVAATRRIEQHKEKLAEPTDDGDTVRKMDDLKRNERIEELEQALELASLSTDGEMALSLHDYERVRLGWPKAAKPDM